MAHLSEINATCKAVRYSYSSRAHEVDALRVDGKSKPGLGKDKTIHLGNNSGYQAVNLAYLMGAEEINLLGFDMQHTGGKSHFHGDHPPKCRSGHPNFAKWVKDFAVLAQDLAAEKVKTTNYSRVSALNCFKKANLERLT